MQTQRRFNFSSPSTLPLCSEPKSFLHAGKRLSVFVKHLCQLSLLIIWLSRVRFSHLLESTAARLSSNFGRTQKQ